VQKILTDFKVKGVETSEHKVRKRMTELLATARDQIMKELK
jgi:hypothetical protein